MSLAKAITERLGGEWRGDVGMVPAPGEPPENRSVIVRDDADGDVHIECGFGFDWKEVKDLWRRAGLLPARPFPSALPGGGTGYEIGKGLAALIASGLPARELDTTSAYTVPPPAGGTGYEIGKGLAALAAQVAGPLPLPAINPIQWDGIDPPPRQWLVDGWLAAGSGAFLTGDGGVGKSLFTQQLCTCLAAGVPFLGLEVERCVALYVTCEDDAAELHRRQASINAALGIDMADLDRRLFLVSLKGELGNELVSFDGDGRMVLAQRYKDLHETARRLAAGMVAIDNVAQTFTGNENVRNQVAAFCNLMDRLAMEIGGTVLFLGHPSKAGAEFSGSTGWEAHVRQRLFLDWADEGGGMAGDRDARVLKRSKANYSRAGAEVELRWHAGAFVLEGTPGAEGGPDAERERRQAAEEAVFLSCLRVRAGQQRPVSDSRNAANYAPKIFAEMPESGRMTKAAMAAAMERLIRIGRIERATPESPLWRGADRKPVLGLREVAA